MTAGDLRFTPGRTLRSGSAASAGLLPEHVRRIAGAAAGFLAPSPTHPMYAGAVVLAARDGVVVTHEAVGHAVRYASYDPAARTAVELPPEQWVPMTRDTIFDLASVTKLFTSLVVVQQVERGRIDLDAPVSRYVPEFAANGKDGVTVGHLLTHTSGLPAWLPLYRDWPTPQERFQAVYAVRPLNAPGAAYRYSDLNLITLGTVVERTTGRALDRVLAEDVTGPLGMSDTGFQPAADRLPRTAATEYMTWTTPSRGMVRGSVHDENAWSLGGVAGHAGVFSTARDLAVLAQTVLNGGRYGRTRVLREESVRAMLTDHNAAFPADSHGLGFELNQHWYMGPLSSPVTAGHTGYTGTSLVIDPLSRSFVILLSNRVHPTRDWGSNNPARRAVAAALGRALPVRPRQGRQAWYALMADDAVATLALPVADGAASARFWLWYDTEDGNDEAAFEASDDDGATWRPVPFELRVPGTVWRADGRVSGFGGRRWWAVSAELPPNVTGVRWRYTTVPDSAGVGRGVYVDGVRMLDVRGRVVFDGERPADAARFVARGWEPSGD
ncbi:serine hydrolase [Wenjunlia vitaminophila]|uniref:Serine hydrolase n=1 Tax=Wenjunlia vitaminophila TaxID=76728 RepID=A0A0T6LT26_WENVI|nr:serine hydrolase domain-containing protein [Wenjunlia vitaminophila]KRV48956.1 serine hydrolase [Wenjunlia vitaminophila]